MEVMQRFSYSLGSKMFECRDKMIHTNDLNLDIINFWNEDYSLTHVGTGCLIFCAMVAFDLVGNQGELVVGNAQGFLTAQGADDKMVNTLLDLCSYCARSVTRAHHCSTALELADCFRKGIWQLDWTPDIVPLLQIRRTPC